MLSWLTYPARLIIEIVKAASALARSWIEGATGMKEAYKILPPPRSSKSESKPKTGPLNALTMCALREQKKLSSSAFPSTEEEQLAASGRMTRCDSVESSASTTSLTDASDREDASSSELDDDEGQCGLTYGDLLAEVRSKIRRSVASWPLFYQSEADNFAVMHGKRTKQCANIQTRLDTNNNKSHGRSSREIERKAQRLLAIKKRDAKNREHRRRLARVTGSIPRGSSSREIEREAQRLLAIMKRDAENREHRRRLACVTGSVPRQTPTEKDTTAQRKTKRSLVPSGH